MGGKIYKITNTINGDFYVGKTVKSLHRRFQLHKSANNDTHLSRAMVKYGVDNFVIELLEESSDDLSSLEMDYIRELSPHYNMTRGGDGGDTPPRSSQGLSRSQRSATSFSVVSCWASARTFSRSASGAGIRPRSAR